jgi:hypothetical protein
VPWWPSVSSANYKSRQCQGDHRQQEPNGRQCQYDHRCTDNEQEADNKIRTVPLWPSETTSNNNYRSGSADAATTATRIGVDSVIVTIDNHRRQCHGGHRNDTIAQADSAIVAMPITRVDSVNMTIDRQQDRSILPAPQQEWIFELEEADQKRDRQSQRDHRLPATTRVDSVIVTIDKQQSNEQRTDSVNMTIGAMELELQESTVST